MDVDDFPILLMIVIPGEARDSAAKGKGTQASTASEFFDAWVPFPRLTLMREARRG